MNVRAYPRRGASFFSGDNRGFCGWALRARTGFTLLEICIVLVILAILLGVMMPSIQSAFTENAVRADERELTLMVRTAMLQSSNQDRDYLIDLTSTGLGLHPASAAPKEAAAPGPAENADGDILPDAEDVSMNHALDSPDKFLIPDPHKREGWIEMPETTWIFKPGHLCPATRIRLARGNAWIEVNFNALTGNVENEAAYFP